MIKHIVLYKFKDTIIKEVFEEILINFNECKNKLNGITSLQFGKNVSLKKHLNHGFNYGLFMEFENEDVIKSYNNLDTHKKAQETMAQYQEDVLVFDIN